MLGVSHALKRDVLSLLTRDELLAVMDRQREPTGLRQRRTVRQEVG